MQVLPTFIDDSRWCRRPRCGRCCVRSTPRGASRRSPRAQLRIVTTGAELAEALDSGAVWAGILALEGVEALGR